MTFRIRIFAVISLFLVGAAWAASPKEGGEPFGPVSQEELKMTSEPMAPGAPAILLYREVERDDVADKGRDYQVHEHSYKRIKILTEEGRKYADVEIPFLK